MACSERTHFGVWTIICSRLCLFFRECTEGVVWVTLVIRGDPINILNMLLGVVDSSAVELGDEFDVSLKGVL